MTTKWEWFPRSYNKIATAVLRREIGDSPQAAREIGQRGMQVAEAADATLSWIYTDPPKGKAGIAQLGPVWRYRPRSGMWMAIEAPKSLRDAAVREAQREVRAVVAVTVLDAEIQDVKHGARIRRLPQFTARMTVARRDLGLAKHFGGGFGLGPEIFSEDIRPTSMAVVLPAVAVLMDALPWIRACDLCGRLFFMIRNQRFCSRAHANVAGQRAIRERAGHKDRDRARPRGVRPVDYSALITAKHLEWVQQSRRTK